MTTTTEALRLARDALQEWDALIKHQYTGTRQGMSDMTYAAQNGVKALHACNAALAAPKAQPAAEPVAWVPYCHTDAHNGVRGEYRFLEIEEKPFEVANENHWACVALYAERPAQPAPAAPQPLTNTVVDAIAGYKAGLAGEPLGFVSDAFTCGWSSGDHERREGAAPAAPQQSEPALWTLQAREALELIATPMRPDGTWNRDREACRQLAAEVLERYGDEDA